MAFTGRNEYSAGGNKQHLNLSALAYEVMESDMFTFGEEKRSGFINTVFENYCPLAEASIARTLNQLEGELLKRLSDPPGDEKTKQQTVKALIQEKRKALLNKVESYERGKSFKIWLNKKNMEYLTEANSECCEDKHYSSRAKYIKAVLEEYARLPYVERERIYFAPFMQEMEAAIRKQKQLRIDTDKDFSYSVYPYRIMSDPLSTANYLVGYSTPHNDPEDEKQPCSFRISALKLVRMEKSKSASLKSGDWKLLDQMIKKRGVQFMVGREEDIHVRLTKSGVSKYYRQVHLRPHCIRTEEDVFVFRCTPAQAEFYFFKFGKDAEILSPLDLRNKFKRMYESAAEIYAPG